jgi:hypothetical protein
LDFSLLLIVAAVSAAPTRPGEPDDCIKGCIGEVIQYGEELNILKNPNLSKYFSKLDEVCGVISTARTCVDKCGAKSNPFALESLNIVCQPESADRLAAIKQCLHYIDHNIDETCTKECAETKVVDETDVTPKPVNPFMEQASANCVVFKCMSRCSIQVVDKECGKEMGQELQGLLQYVLDTQHEDLTKLNLIEPMTKSTPPECSYLYDPSILFGDEEKKEDSEHAAHDPAEDAKTLYTQAQLQLLLKQIELTEKQEHLLERENAKLDMEMSFMAQKVHQREERIRAQQHAVPMFVPPKDAMVPPMPMESMPHPSEPMHPQPSEASHPMEEGSQGPMESDQSHPEEPQHPPMPMEESKPHPRELPPFPMPVAEGMPPPMEFIPIHIPMDAMPRFF